MKAYTIPEGKNQGAMSKGTTCLLMFLCLLGGILFIGAATMYGKYFPDMYRKRIREALVLRNGTEAAERFVKSPVDMYAKFHIFNVTNPQDVIQTGAKPFLMELGPYVFREEKERKIMKWNQERGSVKFQNFRSYHFEPEMSSGKLSDTVNHVNVISLGLVRAISTQPALSTMVGMTEDELVEQVRGNFIETHTVGELLFDGFRMEKYFPEDVAHLCRLRNNCMFGFYYGKNNTFEDEFEVSTGEKDISSIGQVMLYNKEKKLNYHFEDRCNAINGTDGYQVAPGLSQKDTFYVFAPDLCRSFEFQFKEDVEVEGIPAMRYTIPERVLMDPNKRKDNMCFCQKDNDTTACSFKSGVMQLSSCKEGSPVIASQPHFYLGEAEYLQDVDGLKPDQKLHESYLDLEPATGAVIRGSKKVQINMIVAPDSRTRFLKHVKKEFFFPVFWADEVGSIDRQRAEDFRSRVIKPYKVGKWTLLAATVLGAAIVVVVAVVCLVKHRRKTEIE